MNPVAYLKNWGLLRAIKVAWQFKLPRLQIVFISLLTRNMPLEDKIVIESHNDFDCNGGALYDWLIENGYNKNIHIVWRLYGSAPKHLPNNVSCVPVYGPSWKKAWSICTAKWLTSDCTVANKVRSDQISIYMTHGGFGLKNCHGLIKVPSSVDYVISPSPEFDDWTHWVYEVSSSDSSLVHVGYPSLDRLYSRRHSVGYRRGPSNLKTILWMPTFRQGENGVRSDSDMLYPYGVPLIDNESALHRLSATLRKAGVHLIIKLHPKQDLSLISGSFPDEIEFITGDSIKIQSCDTYDLMLEADAMIGDYSAAIYEFLVLDRPVAFVLSDLAEYKIGLIDDAEKFMVGPKIYTFSDLEHFIFDVSIGLDPSKAMREDLLSRLYIPCDSHSSARVAALLGISDL